MKIGIVNDLPMATEILRRALSTRADYSVAWVARDGVQAVAECARETPDLILMDLLMPNMDGVEATRRIMAASPCAILVVTVSVGANAGKVFEAMGAGALDAVDTPALVADERHLNVAPLLAKIDTVARMLRQKTQRRAKNSALIAPEQRQPLVCIGASAGGPGALARILAVLPASFSAALVIVQHVDKQFAQGMAQWLDEQCALPVRIVVAGDRPVAGTILLAATDDHLVLDRYGRLAYTPDPLSCVYRPSVDVFFQSVARHWHGEVVGVLLTGMGKDGAADLRTLRNMGHYTIAQDQATSAVYGMPKAAAALNAAVDVLPLERIGPRLIEVCHKD
jgi:chemotaxis response regulator CheB